MCLQGPLAPGTSYSIHAHVRASTPGCTQNPDTRAPGHHCTHCTVAFSFSIRAHTQRHTHTCACTPCHVFSPTGTWSVHRTKKRWSTASSRKGSSKSPLPLPLNPPFQPLLSSVSPRLGIHGLWERQKMCVTCVRSAGHGSATPYNSENQCFKDGGN